MSRLNIWEGRKVRLRPIVADDWEKFYENDQDSEGSRLSDAVYFPRSEEGTKAWAEEQAAKGPDRDIIRLAIETLEGGELAGCITSQACDSRHGTFKYGIALFRAHWRKGYASEAVRIFLRYFFHELRYEKVNSHVYAYNEGSIALHEHLGFTLEGKLRNMIYTNGKHHDEYIYGMLRSEFDRTLPEYLRQGSDQV